jgi:HAD superfamily hydrolase (TIGR01549 family)
MGMRVPGPAYNCRVLGSPRGIRGIVFDVGGTIMLSSDDRPFESANAAAAADFLDARNPRLDRQRFISTLLHWLREKPKADSDHRQIYSTREILASVARELGASLSEETLAELENAFNAPYISGAEPIPGIYEAVLELHCRYRLAVISNTRSHGLIEGIVRRFGLYEAFDPFLTSAGFGWRKPSRRIFSALLEQWKVAPNEVVMVGDSLRKDVAAAQSAGMKGVLFRAASRETDGGTADAVAESAADLPAIITAIDGAK